MAIFSLGAAFGVSLLLFVIFVLILLIRDDAASHFKFFAAFPIYRAYFLLILCMWLWGANVFVFSRARLNHVFILEADPRTALSHVQIWQYASAATLFFMLSIVGYMLIITFGDEWGFHTFHTDYVHCALSIALLVVALCPFDLFCRSTRVFLFSTLLSVMIAPFRAVAFRDFFLGDQLCSLIKVLLDLNYAVCFYATESFLTHDPAPCGAVVNRSRWLIALLPFVWRLLQCLRRHRDTGDATHHMNAAKYASAILTTFTSLLATTYDSTALLVLWALCALSSSSFSLYWDLVKDWGLMQPDSPTYLLRSKLLFSPIVYYWAIATNAVMRVVWIVNISPNTFGINLSPPFLTMLVAAIEIGRRFQWNVFRLENEFLNNCGKFRAVNVVPIPFADVGGDDSTQHLRELRIGENDEDGEDGENGENGVACSGADSDQQQQQCAVSSLETTAGGCGALVDSEPTTMHAFERRMRERRASSLRKHASLFSHAGAGTGGGRRETSESESDYCHDLHGGDHRQEELTTGGSSPTLVPAKAPSHAPPPLSAAAPRAPLGRDDVLGV